MPPQIGEQPFVSNAGKFGMSDDPLAGPRPDIRFSGCDRRPGHLDRGRLIKMVVTHEQV